MCFRVCPLFHFVLGRQHGGEAHYQKKNVSEWSSEEDPKPVGTSETGAIYDSHKMFSFPNSVPFFHARMCGG